MRKGSVKSPQIISLIISPPIHVSLYVRNTKIQSKMMQKKKHIHPQTQEMNGARKQ